jgi:AcrR family transcriptional regulator
MTATLDRRERKKQQTREALIRAALELFGAKGYEQTTIREISDAVDVATRTFFRYFASKEELVVSLATDFAADFFELVRTRPPEEAPFTALRNAFKASVVAFHDDELTAETATVYLDILRLVERTPPLLAAYLRSIHEQQEVLARTLGEREGIDAAKDLRPQLAATVHLALVSSSVKRALANDNAGIDEVLAEYDASLGALDSALSGHWTI